MNATSFTRSSSACLRLAIGALMRNTRKTDSLRRHQPAGFCFMRSCFTGCRAVAAFALLAITPLAAQRNNRADWSQPFPPHKVIGNVYFVGTVNLGSYLITTPEGHILVNTDFEETVPAIRAGVEKLGFKFSDIKIILGSHAHGDHMEGDAMVKEMTGGRVMAMEQDVPALKRM